MTGHFTVVYFDPKTAGMNMHSITVSAPDAAQAIKKADRQKLFQKYRVERVECLSMVED